MKAIYCLYFLLQIAYLVNADCQPEGEWPEMAAGKEAELPCTNNTVGYQVRKCLAGNIWDQVDTQYCLPFYTPVGISYVDLDLYLSQGNTETIKRDEGSALKSGLLAYYTTLNSDAIGIHRIHSVDTYTSIQIRITTDNEKALSIFQELQREKGDDHVLSSLDEYITRNMKSYYKNTGSQSKADFFSHEVYLRDTVEPTEAPTEAPTEQPTEDPNAIPLETMLILIVSAIALFVVLICGMIVCCCLKRFNKKLKKVSK